MIKSEYKLKGITIQNEFLLQWMLRGVRSFNRGTRRKCPPILTQHLPHILSQVSNISNPYDARLYRAMILLSFHCLLQVGEITQSDHNIQESSVEILSRHLSGASYLQETKNVVIIHFRSTKMDPFGEKSQITWCTTESNPQICPVRALFDFLASRPEGGEFPFCTPSGAPIRRHAFVTIFNAACALAVGNEAHIKTHSICMGGAVYMLLSGWTLDQIMARGRWVMPKIAKKYFQSIHAVFQAM